MDLKSHQKKKRKKNFQTTQKPTNWGRATTITTTIHSCLLFFHSLAIFIPNCCYNKQKTTHTCSYKQNDEEHKTKKIERIHTHTHTFTHRKCVNPCSKIDSSRHKVEKVFPFFSPLFFSYFLGHLVLTHGDNGSIQSNNNKSHVKKLQTHSHTHFTRTKSQKEKSNNKTPIQADTHATTFCLCLKISKNWGKLFFKFLFSFVCRFESVSSKPTGITKMPTHTHAHAHTSKESRTHSTSQRKASTHEHWHIEKSQTTTTTATTATRRQKTTWHKKIVIRG